MCDENQMLNGIINEMAKEAYSDGGKPIVKPTGELVGLIPRTLKALLFPLEKWIVEKEYSLKETIILLEKKLKNISTEKLETPEPHIAVPALQYISYCMDNKELRNMYANLLANSMNKIVKNGVHPSFVEIIKQLCPDEAKILKYIYQYIQIPTITLCAENKKHERYNRIKDFSDIGELIHCEFSLEISKYFNNLTRLGLVIPSSLFSSLTNESLYIPLEQHEIIKKSQKDISENTESEYNIPQITRGYMEITDFGKAFCKICIEDPSEKK